MPIIKRIFFAVLICLPLAIAYAFTFYFLIRTNTGDDRTLFGIFFDLPLALLSLPWSFCISAFGPTLIKSFSLDVARKIETVSAFVALFINVYVLLKHISLNKLIGLAVILPTVLVIIFIGSQ
jgi:hypothetical protein